MQEILKHRREQEERVQRFGQVRPEIAIDFHGSKFVAVGRKLFYGPEKRWKFFADFLLSYVPQLFGREWFEGEIAKPHDQRHPLIQWRTKGMIWMKEQPPMPDGTFGAVPGGSLAAYLACAYDLYIVDHNARLDERLLQRLKHPEQFQGARHELFAEATCLRAGFEIEHENESDPSRRHVEFSATHKATGQKISVEAKSKHRAGVLGKTGPPEPPEELSLRFGKLLNDAVSKNPPYPLVVFLDTNLPCQVAARLFPLKSAALPIPPTQFMAALDRLRKAHNGRDPINLTVFTNHPQHYVKDEEVVPSQHLFTVLSTVTLKGVRHPEALAALHQAANLYGNIPNEFPASRGSQVRKG